MFCYTVSKNVNQFIAEQSAAPMSVLIQSGIMELKSIFLSANLRPFIDFAVNFWKRFCSSHLGHKYWIFCSSDFERTEIKKFFLLVLQYSCQSRGEIDLPANRTWQNEAKARDEIVCLGNIFKNTNLCTF